MKFRSYDFQATVVLFGTVQLQPHIDANGAINIVSTSLSSRVTEMMLGRHFIILSGQLLLTLMNCYRDFVT